MLSNVHIYQIIILLVSTAMIYQGAETFIKGQSGQTLWKFCIRLIVWGGMAAVATFPSISSIFAHIIGIDGNVNAVILTGFLLVFLMIFKLLSAIERLEQNISLITRKEALQELHKHKKNN